eukprot:8291592-Pyramimonas_sp.AAC.1
MATSINLRLKRAAEHHAHTAQQGFVNGRNFARHIVRLDTFCRIASLGDDADVRMPIFVSFDVKAAFPSMSQIWLRKVLQRFLLPEPCVCATRALMCNAVGFLRVGSEVRELATLSSGVPHGCPLSGALWALGMDPLVRALA